MKIGRISFHQWKISFASCINDTTHNSSVASDEGLTLETSRLWYYGVNFTVKAYLIPNFRVICTTPTFPKVFERSIGSSFHQASQAGFPFSIRGLNRRSQKRDLMEQPIPRTLRLLHPQTLAGDLLVGPYMRYFILGLVLNTKWLTNGVPTVVPVVSCVKRNSKRARSVRNLWHVPRSFGSELYGRQIKFADFTL